MKKLLTICVVVFVSAALTITGSSAFAGPPVPHPVYVSVDDMNGSTPAIGDLVFDAWLLARPGEVGNQDSSDWGYGSAIPGMLTVNCGNVFSSWNAGDVLHIEAEEISTGYTGIGEYTLTNENLQFFSGDDGMTLTPEPATLGLLLLGGLTLLCRRTNR